MLRLEALDTIFFRDGKPFNKDGDNWVNSMFPPAPSVFYGALRSTYFAENISLFTKANKDDDPTKNFKIKGVFIQVERTVYFPLPLDLVKNKDQNKVVFPLVLHENSFVSNCPTEMVLKPPADERVENIEEGLLDDISLNSYLSGNNQELPFRRLSEFITHEPRVGIGLNYTTGTAREGLLYRAGMIRTETSYLSDKGPNISKTRKLRIILDYEGLLLPFRGLMKVGGESKAMAYEHCVDEEIQDLNIDRSRIKGKRFKVYLATPAKFSNGWLPGWIDERTLTGTYKGTLLKLLTAAIGRYVPIGGFDMKEKRPKPMFRAVPAGSVYYFEVLDGSDLVEVINKFHYVNISDFDGQQGFGLAFAGGVS